MAIAVVVLKTLLDLANQRKSGVVDVEGTDARVRLYVEHGAVVFADEGTVGETLGRILVREKVISREDYTAALEAMADLRARGKQTKLGQVFVELGVLRPDQLKAALSAQVRRKIVRALGWSSPHVRFVESPGPLAIDARFPTPLEPLVMATLRAANRQNVEALVTEFRDRRPELRGDATPVDVELRRRTRARIIAIGLRPPEVAFAQAIDGKKTIGELLQTTEAVDPVLVVAALLVTDCLALRDPVSPAEGPRAALSMALRAVVVAPALAAPVLPNPMDRLYAEKAFQQGKQLVFANRMEDARPELERAARLFPAMEYRLWAAWSSVRPDDGNDAPAVVALKALAEQALRQDPELGFGYFVQGHLALREGHGAEAMDLFDRARRLDAETAEHGEPGEGPRTAVELRALAPLLTTGAVATDAGPPPHEPKTESAAAPPASSPSIITTPARILVDLPPSEAPRDRDGGPVAPRPVEAPPKAKPLETVATVATVTSGSTPGEPQRLTPESAREPLPAMLDTIPERASATSAPRRSVWGVVAVATLVGAGILMIGMSRRAPAGPEARAASTAAPQSAPARPTPSAEPKPVLAPTPVPVVESPTTAAAEPTEARTDAGASTSATTTASTSTTGELVVPRAAYNHRVYVDGRLLGEAPAPLVAPCGKHAVKIGSAGREQAVDIPCGAKIDVAYP